MMKHTRIHLVRHGEVHNPRGVLYGRLPRFKLSPRGIHQARTTGRFLATHQLESVFSSPLLRARQTALEILEARKTKTLKLRISTFLNEVCTVYEGRAGADVDARDGDVYTGCPAGFEQPLDLVKRAQTFFKRILRHHCGEEVVAVTHGDIIVFSILWAKGAGLTPANKTRLEKVGYPAAYPQHASITTLTFKGCSVVERPRVDYFCPT
jgi:broad specificity phosphatase PhoE